MSKFVDKIEEKRGGQSIRQFCKDFGINHSLWSRILRGEREPSKHVINAALARWPELARALAEDAQAAHAAQAAAEMSEAEREVA